MEYLEVEKSLKKIADNYPQSHIEIKGDPNFITPYVAAKLKINDYLVELSYGEGMIDRDKWIYGVTVVETIDNKQLFNYDLSDCFFTFDNVSNHLKRLEA